MTAKEFEALERALATANEAAQKYADTEDGGTCNFDALAIKVKATEKQMKWLDWFTFKWGKRESDGKTWYVIELDYSGQGNRRTCMAEEACRSMKEQGYDAMVYYQMD